MHPILPPTRRGYYLMPRAPTQPPREAAMLAAMAAGRLADAFALAEAALASGHTFPLALKLRGAARERQGLLSEAASDFQRALAMEPDDAGALNALGSVFVRLGRPQQAAAALLKATAQQPGFAEAHVNLGATHEGLGDLKAAERAYLTALSHRPGHASALAALALLAARRGDHESARVHAEAALVGGGARVAPAHLALAMADLAAGLLHTAEERLRNLLGEAGDLTPHARSMGWTLIGDTLDARGDVACAFEAYARANAILKDTHRPKAAALAGEGLDRVARLHASLKRIPTAACGPHGEPPTGHAHVFLVGFPRSGTTLLGQILSAHPDIVTLDERDNLADAAHAFMEPPERLPELFRLEEPDLHHWRDLYWRRVAMAGVRREGRIFVDKLPMNALGLPLISRLFPEARILLVLRDPRDAVFSAFRRNFAVNASTLEMLDLEGTAQFYDVVMSYAEAALDRFKPPTHRIRYEDFTSDFDGELGAVCDLIGVPWSESLRRFADRAKGSELATPSAAQVARGLYTDGVGAWRRFASQMTTTAERLSSWVSRYGYPER